MTLKKRWLAGAMASVLMMLSMVGSMGVSAEETEEESSTGWENMTIEEREADLQLYEQIAPFVIDPDSDCSVIAATPYDMDAWYGANDDHGYQTLYSIPIPMAELSVTVMWNCPAEQWYTAWNLISL